MAFTAATMNSGTFTPELNFGGGSTAMTFSTQTGAWKRIQNGLVWINIRLILTAKGSSTGDANITGLPFVALSGYTHPVGLTFATLTPGVGDTDVLAFVVGGGSTVRIWKGNGTGSIVQLTHADFTNTSAINISGFYPIS